jgi:hypothetical protein
MIEALRLGPAQMPHRGGDNPGAPRKERYQYTPASYAFASVGESVTRHTVNDVVSSS